MKCTGLTKPNGIKINGYKLRCSLALAGSFKFDVLCGLNKLNLNR